MFLYSIFDKKACVHRTFMALKDDAEAVRSVARVANDGRSDLFMFADDFALYCVCKLDINSGNVSGFSPVKFVCEVSSLIKINESVESK